MVGYLLYNIQSWTRWIDNDVLTAEIKVYPTQNIHQLTEKLNQSVSTVQGYISNIWKA